MEYNPAFLLLSFITAFYLVNRLNAGPIFASFIAVIFPYLVNSVILYILGSNFGPGILSGSVILIMILQFSAAYLTFSRIRNTDSIKEILIWATGGLLVLLFTPAIMHVF